MFLIDPNFLSSLKGMKTEEATAKIAEKYPAAEVRVIEKGHGQLHYFDMKRITLWQNEQGIVYAVADIFHDD